jgi:hypothetical protein
MHTLLGPPASGKTTALLDMALDTLRQRKRVWWVGLPHQRAYVYRRIAEAAGGAVLGLEFLSFQQTYYRLLAAHFGLKPILTGPARVALVGEALMGSDGGLPNPGEARLFSRAVAEAKRFGLGPEQIPHIDAEARRFASVFRRYEELKGNWGRWDYDDFRNAALALVESGAFEPPADLIVVDGFREILPLGLRYLRGLSAHCRVALSITEPLPGVQANRRLAARHAERNTYRAQNPVTEARWVLRSIKRDLAGGINPNEIGVITPEPRIAALMTLADEYGVPLVDYTPRTSADSPQGRLLLDLLDLPDYPTATRLLSIPDLAPLGRAALEQGLAGLSAITRLARSLGYEAPLKAWLERLEPVGDPEDWARTLVDSIPEVRSGPRRLTLLERAKEAKRIASGPDFRRWWAALLSETYEPIRPPGGVALLTPNLAAGVRFNKTYLTYAVEGAYGAGEREDYFVPEEERLRLEQMFEGIGLPRRFLGRDTLLLEELRSRGNQVIVTYPEADQGGPLEAEPLLVPNPKAVARVPEVPVGSRLEVPSETEYRASLSPLNLGPITIEGLRRYDECGFRYWAEGQIKEKVPLSWWRLWVGELRSLKRLNEARLEAFSARFPEAEGWLKAHRELLFAINFGFTWPENGMPQARVDGALNRGGEYHIYTFVAPDVDDAASYLRSRWSELWLAGYLLANNPRQVKAVRLWVWPVLGHPLEAYKEPVVLGRNRVTGAIRWREERVQAVLQPYQKGEVRPKPGFICRECAVRDVCREAKTG